MLRMATEHGSHFTLKKYTHHFNELHDIHRFIKILVNGTKIAHLFPQNTRLYWLDKGVSNNR
jgi:hypothetical protein